METIQKKLEYKSEEILQDYKEGLSYAKMGAKYRINMITIRYFIKTKHPEIFKTRQRGTEPSYIRKLSETFNVPSLRLSGRLFTRMGLAIGDKVKVIADEGKILILPQDIR